MNAEQAGAVPTAPESYWRPTPTEPPSLQPILVGMRRRFVALVAALVLQATIAAVSVLPPLSGRYASEFWGQFALVELLVAAVIALLLAPGAGPTDLPWIGRIFLVVAFVGVPLGAF